MTSLLDDDFLDLLIDLSDAEARFMVIGGYAVGVHGRPRVEPSLPNAQRVLRALAEFGAPAGDLSAEELATPGTGFMMGRPPMRIDLLTRIAGLDFESAWQRSIEVDFSEGCRCRVIGLDDLIINKKAAGRPQDLADVEALERLRRLRGR